MDSHFVLSWGVHVDITFLKLHFKVYIFTKWSWIEYVVSGWTSELFLYIHYTWDFSRTVALLTMVSLNEYYIYLYIRQS